MQKYKSNITTTSGAAVRGVPVHVLAEDGSPASIFLDRAGTVQAANPLSTASDGTFYFYAENGRYSLRTTVDGVTITDADVALLWDPAEVLLSGPLAEAVERAEASAAQAEAAVADSGIVDLVASAQNAVVDAQLALAEASGLGQAAQEAEDAAASAVLASQVATDAANLAVDAAQDAILASAATIKAYATHAEAAIAAALLPDDVDVEVSQDETRAGARTRYKVQAGALVFVVNLDQVRVDLAAATGASLVGFQQEGTGAVATDVQSKLRERVSVKDSGTGVPAIVSAVTDNPVAGVEVNGEEFSSITGVVAPSGGSINLTGQNHLAAIRKTSSGAIGPVYGFQGKTRLWLQKLKLWMDPDPAATNTAALFNWDHGDIDMRDVVADGGVVLDVAGDRNTRTNIALVPDGGERIGLNIFGSKFSRFFWGILKSNTTVSTEKDISVGFSQFDNMGSTYMLFNSPATGSKIENVQLIGNKLGSVGSKNPFDQNKPGYPHRGSFAGHVEYSRLIGNHATGYGGEFFRAEEAAKASVWLGNTAKLNGKDGIEIIPNNAGGTLYTPTLFAIADNVLENTGLVASPSLGWGIGLHTYTSVNGLKNAECIGESTVHDNISKGWAQALQVHQGGYRNLIHHNILVDSEYGIKTWAPSLGIFENLISDCSTAIDFEGGGVLGRIHFRSASGTPAAQVIETGNGAGAVTGWTWETGKFELPNGSNFFELVEMGQRIDAEVIVSVARDGSNYSLESGRLSYDGSTLTFYRTSRINLGGQLLSTGAPFGIKNGNLTIQLFNGSGLAAPNVRVSVSLSGLHVWS